MDKNDSRQRKILVVDDEGDLLKLAKIRLETSGYKVVAIDRGDRAVEVAKAERPDLILLDTVMPGKSGPEVCKELKAEKATRGIPVIIFTAHYPEEEGVRISYKDIGADDYILKPFEAEKLLAKIRMLIK